MKMRPIQPFPIRGIYRSQVNKKNEGFSVMEPVPDNLAFILRDGTKLRTLKELADALHVMDSGTFMHHVNENKNDFARWIKDVYKEYDLAKQLFQSESKDEHQIIVLKHLVNKLWEERK